jgi:hypothetical protein
MVTAHRGEPVEQRLQVAVLVMNLGDGRHGDSYRSGSS